MYIALNILGELIEPSVHKSKAYPLLLALFSEARAPALLLRKGDASHQIFAGDI